MWGSVKTSPNGFCSQFVLYILSIKFFNQFSLLAICQILNEIPNEHWLAILLNIGYVSLKLHRHKIILLISIHLHVAIFFSLCI